VRQQLWQGGGALPQCANIQLETSPLSGTSAKRAAQPSRPTLGYIAPFLVFVAMLGLEHQFSVPIQVGYPIRVALTLAALLLFSRPYASLCVSYPLSSIAMGVAVFAIWIAPDALFGYRHHWLFENSLTGSGAGSLPLQLQGNAIFLAVRVAGSMLLVPVIEELFWRAWLMRWLIDRNFEKVPLGTYIPSAFWLTAVLFASEHGPYWEVGLAAGVIYNWWMIRTKNLGDCILAHAVTNGALAVYVVTTGAWRYWL
jgi:CAAX protease family protein